MEINNVSTPLPAKSCMHMIIGLRLRWVILINTKIFVSISLGTPVFSAAVTTCLFGVTQENLRVMY